MTESDFHLSPWKSSHPTYEDSVFNMRPAPEFATAEVVVASTYRAVGFESFSENEVPRSGRNLDKALSKRKRSPGSITVEAWKTVLHGALQSPKQPKQSAKRFLQLCPMVPDVALYSGSARLAGNSWNPGQLVARMVLLGSATDKQAEVLWKLLFESLSVGAQDDIWARWLQQEFLSWRANDREWGLRELVEGPTLHHNDWVAIRMPAKQFTEDLRAVIRAKTCMTRRQWISVLESVLRVGSVSHVLWICDLNDRLWKALRLALEGISIPEGNTVGSAIFSDDRTHLVYGMPALPIIRDLASRYLTARLGINSVLWALSEGQAKGALSSLDNVDSLVRFVGSLSSEVRERIVKRYHVLVDQHPRELACKKGIGSNIVEFCRYALGQRQTADPTLRGYDQGYQLRKKAEYASAPWIVSLGPVALLAFSHCCLEEASGPRSVSRLREHLGRYGIEIDQDDLARGELGTKLRMLGLILDSPDAESGMLLVPPFEMNLTRNNGIGS
jgi:hypothetical protein